MKKALVIAGGILLVGLAAIYVLIPSKLNIVVVLPVKCNVEAADRSLRDTANRTKWWGDQDNGAVCCQVTGLFRRMVDVMIDDGGTGLPSRLSVVPSIRIDSCLLRWEAGFSSGLNPIARIERYQQAKKLGAVMQGILSRLGSRLEDQRLVYGMVITEGNTMDSALVSTERIFDHYPSDSVIYSLIGKLRLFVGQNGGHETGYPMLNVTKELQGRCKVEVGVPIDGYMNGKGSIHWRRLIRVVFLEADVRGGDRTVRKAVSQMANYISDYQRTVMAIPYQSLITDRMKERDTTKWVTRLYVPVFPIHPVNGLGRS
ncbi:MAG TPA: hypothetical protein VL978_16230 [Puia sp.]|nr:hypothetical protein [Puia sp.]